MGNGMTVSRVKRDAMIGPYGIGRDVTGQAIALQARYLGWHPHDTMDVEGLVRQELRRNRA